MPKRYLVPPKRQMSRMTCVPTAVWMLHRWYLDKVGQTFTTPMFNDIVDISPEQWNHQVSSVGGVQLSAGLKVANLSQFAREVGLESAIVDITPQAFEAQLMKYGPFIYVDNVALGQLPADLLLKSLTDGTKFHHVVLVTGIESKAGGYVLYFNDPSSGPSSHLQFNDFVLRRYPPMGGTDRSLILYFTRNTGSN